MKTTKVFQKHDKRWNKGCWYRACDKGRVSEFISGMQNSSIIKEIYNTYQYRHDIMFALSISLLSYLYRVLDITPCLLNSLSSIACRSSEIEQFSLSSPFKHIYSRTQKKTTNVCVNKWSPKTLFSLERLVKSDWYSHRVTLVVDILDVVSSNSVTSFVS